MAENDCMFCKLVRKGLPTKLLYEDADAIVVQDIHPKAPVHWLIIPKVHIDSLNELKDSVLAGKLLLLVPKMAKQAGVFESGYKTMINTGKEGGQLVFHLHVHLLAGKEQGEV